MRRSIPLLLLLVFATGVFAQAPYLIKDLGNSGSAYAQSSDPRGFLDSGGKLFFAATTENNGLEPWVRDAGVTRLLRDINGGAAGSNVTLFMELTPGVVIFVANDGVNGPQLWRSDGTEAGTALVKIVNATTSPFFLWFSYGGKVFFTVDDGVHGRETWVTDGTAGGTQLLVDTVPGPANGGSGIFFRFGNTTRFFAPGGIYSTDGTPAGTTLDIPLENYRGGLAVTGNTFYFFNADSVHGMEPWKSDGTLAGTSMITEIRSGVANYSITMAPSASGAVFFADDGTGGGGRLWTTGGTAASTVPLAAFPATGTANYTLTLYPTASKGVFFSDDWNVWRTDGTQAGTYVATTASGSAFTFFEAFSKVYFTAWVGPYQHLFHTDGSANAPAVDFLSPMPAKSTTFTGGKLWFSGMTDAHGAELWVSHDGAALGTELIANLAPDPDPSSTPTNFKAAGPYLYFHPLLARGLWRSDGTSDGTIEVSDVTNGLSSPAPFGSLTPYRGDLYYHNGHTAFYRVDGVNGGATKIGDYQFDVMTADENAIYMWGWSSQGMFTSDGTAAGTIPLYDPNDPEHFHGYDSIDVLPYNGYTWIRCFHGLYRTAGMEFTTQLVASMTEESNEFLWSEFGAASGLLYSYMFSDAYGGELWRSDGTGAGSFMVKDLNPGTASSNPSNFTAAGRLMFFTATDAGHGTEVWRTDGTTAGTFMLKDIRPGTASSQTSALASLGEVVYFAANDGTSGIELWKSDGTVEGTVLVRDLAPGAMSSKPAFLAAAGGRIWFSANDGLHGHELWSTDGTEEGTVLAGDILPGSSSSSPDQMTAVEATLFFTATTNVEGRELWGMPLTTAYASVTGGHTDEGNSGTRALRFTIRRHGVNTGAASVAYAVLAGTATEGEDYSPAAGTIQFAAGETVKTVDVNVLGDTATEGNETLFLQLSSPSGVALQDAVAPGVIDDDDPRADLAVEILQNPRVPEIYEASRVVKVTNHGPANASAITVTFTESPYEFSMSIPDGIICTKTMPSQCTIPFLQPGQSLTLQVHRDSLKGLVDPALPPGRTVTVQVSSSVTDPSLSNNTASILTTGNGMLQLPSQLVIGTSVTATFDLGANAASPADVTLTSSAANVLVTPATAQIQTGQRTATFTLTTSAGADKTLLTATIAAAAKAALVAPIVASGQSPTLDVAIVAETQPTYQEGELFVIPVRVAARYPDGTLPAGLVTLFDDDGNPLSQLALDLQGAATFTEAHPEPGTHHYRIGYSGDAGFNAVNVPLPTITVEKARPTVTIHAPERSCSNTVEFRIEVHGPQGVPAPTGTITLANLNTTFGTYTLGPNGVPGQSEVTVTLNQANGTQFVNATYSGDASYSASTARKDFFVGCTAMNLAAAATSSTTVALSWTQPAPATNSYAIYRASSIEGPFLWITGTTGLSAVDNTAQPGRVYVYYVGGFGPVGTPPYYSRPDIASTFAYTDNPLVGGTPVKSAHLNELRSMATALRNAAGLAPLTFAGPVSPGSAVRSQHVTDLRSSIDASRARLGLPAIGWLQQNAAAGGPIRAATLQELRGAAN